MMQGVSLKMKLSLILLSILASPVLAGITIKEFEEEFHQLWSDPEDEKAAAEQLAKAEASIEEDNLEYEAGESSFSEQLNALSALPEDEFAEEKLGALEAEDYAFGLIEIPEEEKVLSPEQAAILNQTYAELDRMPIPSSFDARTKFTITSPKNQQSCGSCAAFAATAVHETCLAKAGAVKDGLDLSEQQLLDCGYNGRSMNGCNGAWVNAYTEYLANAGGTHSHEAQYPYLDRDPNLKCMSKPKWSSGAIVQKAIVDNNCNEKKLKQLVVKYGAVATGIYASDSGLSNVGRGVFDKCSTTKINHAVTVVGYGVQNKKPYWLIKNSWGRNWGDGGYVKIRRGTGACGVAQQCVAAECVKKGYRNKAPVAPPPPPIPANQICDISGIYKRKDITGNYKLTTRVNGKKYIADVKCKNSKCSPRIAGPSNACMYICGKLKC